MDVFALFFIVSFIALVITLAVMHIRKCMNKGNGVVVGKDFWLERGEYDGSEWWSFKTTPQCESDKFTKLLCVKEDWSHGMKWGDDNDH